MKQTTEAPRPPREFVSSIPPALEQVVLHALEKRPEDRPANADEFRKELMETAERLGSNTRPSPVLLTWRRYGASLPSRRPGV